MWSGIATDVIWLACSLVPPLGRPSPEISSSDGTMTFGPVAFQVWRTTPVFSSCPGSGYRKYLTLDRDTVAVNQEKIEEEARYDGKWVLKTNTTLTAEQTALKYKELWQVEQVFRDMKSVLDTRPIFHKLDETIRGHVFCSFLALVIRKELDRRLEKAGHCFEWADIKQDLKALQEITIEDRGKTLAIRSECLGICGKIFQAVGVAIPPTIREVA